MSDTTVIFMVTNAEKPYLFFYVASVVVAVLSLAVLWWTFTTIPWCMRNQMIVYGVVDNDDEKQDDEKQDEKQDEPQPEQVEV